MPGFRQTAPEFECRQTVLELIAEHGQALASNCASPRLVANCLLKELRKLQHHNITIHGKDLSADDGVATTYPRCSESQNSCNSLDLHEQIAVQERVFHQGILELEELEHEIEKQREMCEKLGCQTHHLAKHTGTQNRSKMNDMITGEIAGVENTICALKQTHGCLSNEYLRIEEEILELQDRFQRASSELKVVESSNNNLANEGVECDKKLEAASQELESIQQRVAAYVEQGVHLSPEIAMALQRDAARLRRALSRPGVVDAPKLPGNAHRDMMSCPATPKITKQPDQRLVGASPVTWQGAAVASPVRRLCGGCMTQTPTPDRKTSRSALPADVSEPTQAMTPGVGDTQRAMVPSFRRVSTSELTERHTEDRMGTQSCTRDSQQSVQEIFRSHSPANYQTAVTPSKNHVSTPPRLSLPAEVPAVGPPKRAPRRRSSLFTNSEGSPTLGGELTPQRGASRSQSGNANESSKCTSSQSLTSQSSCNPSVDCKLDYADVKRASRSEPGYCTYVHAAWDDAQLATHSACEVDQLPAAPPAGNSRFSAAGGGRNRLSSAMGSGKTSISSSSSATSLCVTETHVDISAILRSEAATHRVSDVSIFSAMESSREGEQHSETPFAYGSSRSQCSKQFPVGQCGRYNTTPWRST